MKMNTGMDLTIRIPLFLKHRKGLDEEIVRQISFMKKEPEWMLDFRLKALGSLQTASHA